MQAMYFLIPLSLLMLGIGAWALIWAINNGQYDDPEGASWRVIYEDRDRRGKTSSTHDEPPCEP